MAILDKEQFKYLKDGCRPVNNDCAEAIMKLVEAVEVLTEALKQECICSKRLRISLVKDTCNVCIALEKVWGKDEN